MVCNEEVFTWFKELSGAKRIELMCGLISMCIPLEIRFFGAIVQDLAKKDYNALREAELKANNNSEMELICCCNLFNDKSSDKDEKPTTVHSGACPAPVPVTPAPAPVMGLAPVKAEVAKNTLNHTKPVVLNTCQQEVAGGTLNPASVNPAAVNPATANGSGPGQSMAANCQQLSANCQPLPAVACAPVQCATMPGPVPCSSPPAASSQLSSLSSRSKLIISLCLLNPSNRACSSLAFKVLRNQLTPDNVLNAISQRLYLTGSYNDIYSEVILLLTMAVHHPAFSYEQRNSLEEQKRQVERAIEELIVSRPMPGHFNMHHMNQYPFVPHHAHHPQYAHSPHPSTQHNHYINRMTYPTSSSTSQSLPNAMSNLYVSSTTPTSSPSPTTSPPSPKQINSVAGISPIPFPMDVQTHANVVHEPAVNHFLLTTNAGTQPSSNDVDPMGCGKALVSCYNCGSHGHRGDECKAQAQDEATR